MSSLLSVDLGLKTGLALYGSDGRLKWYRSQNYASPRQLKSAAYGIFNDNRGISALVLEGGGRLADIWIKEAHRRNMTLFQISAETWRRQFLYRRQQRSGKQAKKNAETLARNVIKWSGAKQPTSLRHDAAEAILAGLWGVLQMGWIIRLPSEIK